MKEELNDEVQEDLQDILSESQQQIVALTERSDRPYPDFGFTAEEYRIATQISLTTASRVLQDAFHKNVLERRKVHLDGRMKFLYYPPGTWPE